MRRVGWMLVLGTVMWSGCGGGEKTAVQKCDDYLGALCDRAVGCSGRPAAERESCVQSLQLNIPCGSAKKVSETFNRCMNQIQTIACDLLFTMDQAGNVTFHLPVDCNGAILSFEPGEPATSTRFEGASGALKFDPGPEPDDP